MTPIVPAGPSWPFPFVGKGSRRSSWTSPSLHGQRSLEPFFGQVQTSPRSQQQQLDPLGHLPDPWKKDPGQKRGCITGAAFIPPEKEDGLAGIAGLTADPHLPHAPSYPPGKTQKRPRAGGRQGWGLASSHRGNLPGKRRPSPSPDGWKPGPSSRTAPPSPKQGAGQGGEPLQPSRR